MKKAFTLVEMIVVVGILGILTAVLVSGLSGSTESARAVKCLSNMRMLAMSSSMTGEDNSRAATIEATQFTAHRTQATTMHFEQKGWVSYDTRGFYTKDMNYHGIIYSDEAHDLQPIGLYETNFEKSQYAITNGWMSSHVGGNRDVYVCPSHRKHSAKPPHWSYVMRCDAMVDHYLKLPVTERPSPELLLAFAEVQFLPTTLNRSGLDETETSTDGVLDPEEASERIGCNHFIGKTLVAHVAFFDGHAEKLRVDGISDANLLELTLMLCEGKAIHRNGDKYEEFE